jgi:hypothetical protein
MKSKISIFLFAVALSFTNCKKEEEDNNSSVSSNNNTSCNCGTIANDGIDIATNCYWLEIRNECSGNKQKFCFDEDIWMNNHVGDRFCVTNVSSW